MSRLAERRDSLDLPRLEIHERDHHRPECEAVEIRAGTEVRHEGKARPVGGEGGLKLRVTVIGEPDGLAALHIDHEEVRDPAGLPGEDDPASVRREGRGADLADRRGHPDDPVARPVLGIVELDLVSPLGIDDDGHGRSVGGPRARGIEEAHGVVVRVPRRAGDRAQDLSGACIRQIQLDREEVLLREVGHVSAVRAQRRREVLPPGTRRRGKQQGPRFLGRSASFHQGRVPRLHGLAPSGGEGIRIDAENRCDSGPPLRAGGCAHHQCDSRIPVLTAHIGPEGVSEPVGEIAAGVAAQVVKRGEGAVQERVTDPHCGERRFTPQ